MLPGKASLDPLSNSLFLSERPIFEYLSAALDGKLPDFMLPSFLHEATHHWCLTDLVGTALAQIELQVQRMWIQSPVVQHPICGTMWAKVQAARQALEPLMEGIALFAEFDAYPGSSEIISPVMGWLAYLFGRSDEIPEDLDAVQKARYILCAYRTSELALRRKSDVLVRPLRTDDGGYLLGYLSVKSCWANAIKRSKRLADSDLFLTYLRNLVFQDAVMVDILRNQRIEETIMLQQLVLRLHERLKLFGSADLEDRVAEFENAIVETGGLSGRWECLYLDSKAVESTSQQMEAEIRETTAGRPGTQVFHGWLEPNAGDERRQRVEETRRTLAAALAGGNTPDALVDWAPVAHRVLIRIRIDKVDVTVSGQGDCKVEFHGIPCLAAPALAGAPAGAGEGQLALYFVPDDLALGLICVRESEPVCAEFPERVSKTTRRIAVVAIAQVLLSEAMRHAIQTDLTEQENHGAGLTGFQTAANNSITNLFLNFALAFVPDANLMQCRQMLEERGFWRILGENGDLVRALAVFGLIRSYTDDPDLIRAVMQMHEFDFDEQIGALRKAQRDHGYPLLVPRSDAPEEAERGLCFV